MYAVLSSSPGTIHHPQRRQLLTLSGDKPHVARSAKVPSTPETCAETASLPKGSEHHARIHSCHAREKETRVSGRQNGPHKSTCNLLMRAAQAQAGLCLLLFLGQLGLGFCKAEDHLREKRSFERIHLCPHSRKSCQQWPSARDEHLHHPSCNSVIHKKDNAASASCAVTTRVPRNCSSAKYQRILQVRQARDAWPTNWYMVLSWGREECYCQRDKPDGANCSHLL